MKRLSIKTRITLWYALLLLCICAAAMALLLLAARKSADEVTARALRDAAAMVLDELEVDDGRLEIDSDIDDVPGVYPALLAGDGRLIYGRLRVEAPFEEERVRSAQGSGHRWMIYDVRITGLSGGEVWLRLHMAADAAQGVFGAAVRFGLWLLPLLAVAALAGGYILTARAFRPVQRMTQLAASIAEGRDLSGRVSVSGNGDELHALGVTLNGMLGRLERAFERERRFTSDAAHELRTPLNAITTQCEYALSRTEAASKDEAIACVLGRAEEMSTLVGQLLLLARMEGGQMPLEDACALDEMLEGLAADMEPVAAERGICLAVQAEPCRAQGNRAMLTRAFVNLMDNAIRYGRPGGHVRMRLEREACGAAVMVEDDGCGLTREELAHVFDRFWRAEGARSTPGTGIGLSIVQSVAQAHGGSVEADSAPGRGTRFIVHLPDATFF